MDLRSSILEEHSKTQSEKIVRYIGNDPRKFAVLIRLFTGSEYRITQRAGWPLSDCVRANPHLITPHWKKILAMLQREGLHDAVTRNVIRILQYVEIPKKYHGKIMTICFDFIASETAPVAVKAFSLTVLDNLSKSYPGIGPELKLIIEERWPHETAAFHSRGRKILARLERR